MKKFVFLSFAMLCIVFFTIAQNPIPNPGFENWENDNKPADWQVLNIDVPLAPVYTVFKSTDVNTGSYAMEIRTVDIVVGAVSGIANLATIYFDLSDLSLALTAGIPFSNIPIKLKMYLKFVPQGTDTAMVAASFTKWNSTTQTRDTIGGGVVFLEQPINSYTLVQFLTPIIPFSTPDSMNVIFFSSYSDVPQIGTKLLVDDVVLEFIGSGGVESISLLKPKAYPNPTSDIIYFYIPEIGISAVTVYDMTGKAVLSAIEEQQHFNVNMSTLPEGIYSVVINQNNNRQLHKIVARK